MGATECFSENPYKEDINTGTKHGVELFEATTKPFPSDQHIEITIANAQKILDLLEDKASLYRWSCIISKIQDTAGDKMDLLTQYNQLMHNNLKCHANCYNSGNPLTAAVPATTAMQVAILDPANNTDHRKCFTSKLELQREKFEWAKTDGSKVIDSPTLAWVILTYVKLSSNVGVDKEVKMIKATTMTHYKSVAVSQEKVFTEINFTRYIFRALCTASNPDFLCYIKAKKDPFDKGKAIVVSNLMADTQNRCAINKEEYNCRDPKENTILALTTKLIHLESKLKENQSGGGGGRKKGN
eukprot:5139749-Ditylum_brightwellii.AAC.1